MNQLRYYILEGQTPRMLDSFEEWEQYLRTQYRMTNCTIARNDFQAVTVLTVFNGQIPFNDEQGMPILFETIVFRGMRIGLTEHGDLPADRKPDFSFHRQYTSYQCAIEGHHQVCALIIETL
jgi:hypothetical protein